MRQKLGILVEIWFPGGNGGESGQIDYWSKEFAYKVRKHLENLEWWARNLDATH